MRELSDRASGCFDSEASVDLTVVKWQLRLLVVGLLLLALSCGLPWVSSTASYNAPYDGANAVLEVDRLLEQHLGIRTK